MKFKKILAIGLMMLSGCASVTQPIPPFSEDDFSQRKATSLQQAETAEAKAYFAVMAKLWNKYLLDGVNFCGSKSNRSVEILLTVNKQGEVSEVIGKPWNFKSKCFADAYTGLTLPEPPASPFYLSYEMR